MTTLGSRSKRLQASILQPLENLQNEILYHLTALELQRGPWAKQVNQTLNHLKNIQGYLEKTAGEICHNQTRIYTERLKTYLTSSNASMASQLGDTTTKCRPFYDIFDASRIFLCRNIVDFINGLWFSVFLTLLLWAIGTPVGLNLMTIQMRLNGLSGAQTRSRDSSRSDRSDERGRRRERSTGTGTSRSRSTQRDRSTSSSRGRATATTTPRTTRPPLRRTATEETLDIADDDSTPTRPQHQQHQEQQQQRSRDQERDVRDRERDVRDRERDTRDRERDQRSRERELSRAREMAAVSTPARSASRNQLHRQGTEDFDLDESETYGTSSAHAVAAARRTPPRSAPPPPPPPAAGMMNRYGSERSVRWNAEEDVVFEDVDSPNPMYLSRNLD